jgi:branched-subunit amino acid aminotransferase/4-amino-4-deoxychorismate lyase
MPTARRVSRSNDGTAGTLSPMDQVTKLRIEIDGKPADEQARAIIDHEAWGHFTAMQVRDRRTRGLDLHLARLDAAQREMYGTGLDREMILACIAHALGDLQDASVRVYGYWAGVIVTVRPPAELPSRPHALASQRFQRPLARLKHSGSWAGGYYRQLALDAGFDEALLVDQSGCISEGGISNVGFWRDGTVVWPDAPMLAGITMLVLRRELAVAQATDTVRLADLPCYDGMFVCNSRGWAPVGQVDDMQIPVDAKLAEAITTAYAGAAQDSV